MEYNKGLFVLDVKHMPGGICGTWPAFWSLGREPWPVKGEIDIIEGVNQNTNNNFVLHTDTTCSVNGKGQTGAQNLYNCALDSSAGSTGCGVTDARGNSFGKGFNAAEGGYYVTEWQAEGIKIWFFPRGSQPHSLLSDEPDTTTFGEPAASFQGDCDIEKRFMDQRFIFTNTFCGDWGGNVYAQSGCPMYNGLSGMDSCKKYVAENPEVFKDAYWRVSSFKTYNKRAITSSSSVAPSSTPHASSSSVRVSSSSVIVSSSSVHVSSSSVARSSSALSSSVAPSSSATPTPHVSSSVYPSSTPAASSSYPASVSSSAVSSSAISSSIAYSSTVPVSTSSTPYSVASSSVSSGVSSSASETPYVSSSISASKTPYSHDSSSTMSSASASETPYASSSSSIYSSASSSYPVSSETPYSSSSIVYSSEILYPSGSSSSVYPAVSSYPIDSKSSSSTPIYSTSAPVYSVYPEGNGYGYGDKSSKTPDASSKSSEYPTVSKVPDYGNGYIASSKGSEYDTHPTASSKSSQYGSYPAASSSAPVYGHNHPKPSTKSTPVYSDYPGLPSFTPLYSTYPAVSSQSSYGEDKKPSDSYQTTTAYRTTYVDVCSTGYTTITTKVTAIQTPAPYPTTNAYYAPPGFEVTTKYCAQGCGEGPKTVTVTVPCTTCQATGVPNKPTGNSPYAPAQPSKPSTPEDYSTKVTATKIITLTKVPVPESQYYTTQPSVASPSASSVKYPDSDSGKSKPVAPSNAGYTGGDRPIYPTGSAPAPKPVAPSGSVGGGKPVYPTVVGIPGSNVTISYGTATSKVIKPSQTGYKVPEFTGAASAVQVGGVVAGAVAAFAAMMM